jgi:HAD superfamily hydrolase (TIGR01549 family)
MKQITAIGFDLFNTLITVNPDVLPMATSRLVRHLRGSGFTIEKEPFIEAYRAAAFSFLEESKQSGIETHNSIWISAALETQGQNASPDDPRIWEAVDDYFSAFYEKGKRIPGTRDLLNTLKKDYPLALLSNFTHGPAAREILDRLSLTPFFDALLISGDLGYRKPFPVVFDRLVEELGQPRDQILFIGDDPEADVAGSLQAGLQPAWMTYVRDHKLPFLPYTQSEKEGFPETEVPRITTWDDLLTLLTSQKA